jgi:phosphopantothenate-cysteine ligase
MNQNVAPNILVTSGGTKENIDSVRVITNTSTGKLGARIADEFTKRGAQVSYLFAEDAAQPVESVARLLKIRSSEQFTSEFENSLRTHRFDCVIHAMAVSDFTPTATVTLEEFANADHNIAGFQNRSKPFKISSDADDIVIFLHRTKKAISMIKDIQPSTLLVGFKLLAGASEEELFKAGLDQIKNNGCDLVLLNDITGIADESHHQAFLMNRKKILRSADTKHGIAQMIADCVLERIPRT